eukprot:CAMPEP_0194206324 /NCGR_PEP_ID=MMETSP0156-20130528/5380_1 /TAXON_ID=33649 /ORGANISM="Thalassionema nitzschioides, Strain L26-B" /LENGTH=467 /DNA_ID=CAMNT_0038932815 /DNA_START=41 /DNA_END=1441 /DNA_ORIENTATION=+
MSKTHFLSNLDALSLSKHMEDGKLSALELMEATLERIDEVNTRLNAIILLGDRNALLEEASKADKNKRKGWLHGIPIAVKDTSNVEGILTTMGGSPFTKDAPPPLRSDPFVQRLIDAGAIVIGKTNTPESALGSHTFNREWGTTLNPYNASLSSGGSSGGAAVAVASRILAVADGSDMMGSLRNPSGWNNIYSIRPTAGILDERENIGLNRNPLDYPISTVGPIGRTVEDIAQYLETMVGDKKKFSVSDLSKISQKSFRVAWLGDWNGYYPFEDGILTLCRSALGEMDKIIIDDIQDAYFDGKKLWESWKAIRSAVLSSTMVGMYGLESVRDLKSTIRPELKWEIEKGMALCDKQLKEAQQSAEKWSKILETSVFSEYDAILMPSAQTWPFPAEWEYPKAIAGIDMDTYHRWMEITVPVSLAGLPCVTVPAGFGDNGLPMGIQIAGRRHDDIRILKIAQMYHKATFW